MRWFLLVLGLVILVLGAVAVGLPPHGATPPPVAVAPKAERQPRIVKPDNPLFALFRLEAQNARDGRSKYPHATFHNGSDWPVAYVMVELDGDGAGGHLNAPLDQWCDIYRVNAAPGTTVTFDMTSCPARIRNFKTCRLTGVERAK